MKSTELRIGNYVTPWRKKHNGIISNELDFVCLDTNELIDILYEGYKPEPLPLTEEWLIKFGFESDNYTDEDRTPIYYIDKNGFNITFEYSKECFLESIGIDIEHVHQLQNLYHALTCGLELTIKEL